MTETPTPPSPSELADLAACAVEARRWAYAPYSGYAVGAALLTASGKIYDGVNVENAAYPDSLCAERVAAVKAVSEGERDFVALAAAPLAPGTRLPKPEAIFPRFVEEPAE